MADKVRACMQDANVDRVTVVYPANVIQGIGFLVDRFDDELHVFHLLSVGL